MPRSPQHKARTREQVAATAGRVFRRDGYAAAAVGALMAEAGLTHGGFYAHFDSKQALFAEVLASDHGLIRRLARRDPHADWTAQTIDFFADYLHPAHRAEVLDGCSFAALTGDVARSDDAVREAYRAAWRRAIGEVLRGPGEPWRRALARCSADQRAAAAALLGSAVGALGIAQALAPSPAADELLRGISAQVAAGLRALAASTASSAAVSAGDADGSARRDARRRG